MSSFSVSNAKDQAIVRSRSISPLDNKSTSTGSVSVISGIAFTAAVDHVGEAKSESAKVEFSGSYHKIKEGAPLLSSHVDIVLKGTDGKDHNLKEITENKNVVIFGYPQNSIVGPDGKYTLPLPLEDWIKIDGAAGCTANRAGFKNVFEELSKDYTLYGISTQDHKQQQVFAKNEGLPYVLLSDENLIFLKTLDLKCFNVINSEGVSRTCLSRFVFVVKDGVVKKIYTLETKEEAVAIADVVLRDIQMENLA